MLISTYELGHQPLGLARPAADLLAARHHVACADLSAQALDEAAVRDADFIGVSLPMHTATRLAAKLAPRLRALNPRAHLCFYGLYAGLNAEGLLGAVADSVIGGEFETPLLQLVNRLAGQAGPEPFGVMASGSAPAVFLGRQVFAVPRRDLLPPLDRYSRLALGEDQRLVGYVEASRGCAHRCLHCPITPVYAGRLRIVPAEVVLADVRQLVELGAEHITFGDPDFFNGVKHSLRIAEALHAEFPSLTFDATIKVEHLLEHRDLLPRLRDAGCLFIVSAVEAINDTVLANLAKGHTRADIEQALEVVQAVGIALRPTFVAFTPWMTLADYVELLEFVDRHGLVRHVDPVQYAIRLLVPRGSSLLGTPALAPYLGPFDEETLTYTWRHPDPTLARLHAQISAVVEQAAQEGAETAITFEKIRTSAWEALTGHGPPAAPRAGLAAVAVPRLTEPWFC